MYELPIDVVGDHDHDGHDADGDDGDDVGRDGGYDDDGADHGGDHVDVADDVGDDEDQYCNMNRRKPKCGPEHQHGNGRGCNGGMTQ